MTKKPTSKKPILEFASLEEEAAFWDTHSTADYESAFKPVRARFAKNLSQGITIRLDPETLDKVRAQAYEKGIGATTLIRMWVLEHVNRRPPGM
jgi:predicted DNA binding CopG/RHH family protein